MASPATRISPSRRHSNVGGFLLVIVVVASAQPDFEFEDTSRLVKDKSLASTFQDDESFLGSGDSSGDGAVTSGYPDFFRATVNVTSFPFTPSLLDTSSSEFRNRAGQVKKSIEDLYADVPGEQTVTVLSFSKGSVMVTFDLGSVGGNSKDAVSGILKDAVQRGRLGDLGVSDEGFALQELGDTGVTPSVVSEPPVVIPSVCASDEFRCNNGQCIVGEWKCDGAVDCRDRSDEENCATSTEPPKVTARPCAANQFECASGQCIVGSWMCDGNKDCTDGSDELNCASTATTSGRTQECDSDTEFTCGDKSCIPASQKCDGTSQCGDGSDEVNCAGSEGFHLEATSASNRCTNAEFRCRSGQCIDNRRRCDRRRDCRDGSDEYNCAVQPRRCSSREFRCVTSGRCIDIQRRCNRRVECRDGSDERDCSEQTCTANEWRCENGPCIDNRRRCDGRRDCPDNTDELDCPCRSDQFRCGDGQCLEKSSVCNRRRECSDGSDESNCPSTSLCRPGEFVCDGRRCVPDSGKCDGIRNCIDRTDELNCRIQLSVDPRTLRVDEGGVASFTCSATGGAAILKWTKDGQALPAGASDVNGRLYFARVSPGDSGVYSCEAQGSPQSGSVNVRLSVDPLTRPTRPPTTDCRADEARCGDGKCIPRSALCNGVTDCNDNSDERTCGTPNMCEPNEFKCRNGKCASKVWRCDGDNDCGDNSDELNCPVAPPGSPCRSDEYRCADRSKCIPKSYHCDGEPDCDDQSDERGCLSPQVTKAPDPTVEVFIGATVTISCEAIGTPPPLITWRLNWGHVGEEPRVTQESKDGRGVLTIRQARLTDQGAYTCEAINVKGSIFAQPDAILIVKSETAVCPAPLYNDNALDRSQCKRCFCFGVTDQCTSTKSYRTSFGLHNQISIVDETTGAVGSSTAFQFQPQTREFVLHSPQRSPLAAQDAREMNYWSLPGQFLMDKITSYGGELTYTAVYETQGSGRPNTQADVIMKGNGITLYYTHSQQPAPNRKFKVSVPLEEGQWEKSPRGGSTITELASREDVMMVLQDLDYIYIKAMYDTSQAQVRLSEVSMSYTVPSFTLGGVAYEVEECRCPAGYTGTSCQNCAPGYQRVSSGQYLGRCVEKSACSCNGHSDQCDRDGVCTNCQHNTEGSQCERCARGFYGDARRGTPNDCRPCPCPLTIASNQFSRECELNRDNVVVCTNCPPGYEGDRCERCARGYTGNPSVPGDRCRPIPRDVCNKAGTLSTASGTGRCICKQYVTGRDCSECRPNSFYLTESYRYGCIPCFCMGVTSTCTSTRQQRSQTTTVFGRDPQGFYLTDASRRAQHTDGLRSDLRNRELSYGNIQSLPRDTYYWSLPERYLGNKLTAYGGNLQFTARYRADAGDVPNDDADIEINGNDITLIYRHSMAITSDNEKTFQVPFYEQFWQRLDGEPASREHMLMALAGLKYILVKATYTASTQESSLRDVSLDVAENRDTGRPQAFPVEQCSCPPGYQGLSCESCAPGYKRTGGGLYLGTCERCECNGHSDTCDVDTGVCQNCRDNTVGENCERCAPGFYGNPARGGQCRPCPCPLTVSSNQFSRTCRLDTDGQVTCLDCPPGYEGRQCERCASGYVGDPRRVGDVCKRPDLLCDCEAAGTEPSQADRCNPTTGQCVCKRNVEGKRCDKCKPGYFNLDSKNPDGCLKCACSGRSQECTSARYFKETIFPQLAERGDQVDRFYLTTRNLVNTRTASYRTDPNSNEITAGFNPNDRKELLFFRLPDKFLGNKVTAYGSSIKFSLRFDTADGSRPERGVDVELRSPYGDVYHVFRTAPQPGVSQDYDIPITEASFIVPRSRTRLSRDQFVRILSNITDVLVRATYHTKQEYITLRSIAMDVGVPYDTGSEYITTVESCKCPAGYDGLSCESCALGSRRMPDGRCRSEGLSRCDCNGHSDQCDDQGRCQNCRDNTEGDRCERCVRGYRGDPTRGPCVRDAPPIYVRVNTPNRQSVTQGQRVQFECVVTSQVRDDDRTYTVVWTKDGGQLSDRVIDSPNGLLTIENVQPEDAGTYTCTGSNELSVGTDKAVLTVTNNRPIPKVPSVRIDPRYIQATAGDFVAFHCIADGFPRPTIEWTATRIGELTAQTRTFPNGTMLVPSVSLAEQSDYTCTARNSEGTGTMRTILYVKQDTVCRQGEFRCGSGRCIPSSRRCDGTNDCNDGADESGCRPARCRRGEFQCRNGQCIDGRLQCNRRYDCRDGSDERNCNQFVYIRQPELKVTVGGSVSFDCYAQGREVDRLVWTKQGGVLPPGSSVKDGVLTIPNVQPDYAGNYICSITTLTGLEQTAVARLVIDAVITINRKPTVVMQPAQVNIREGESAILQCVADGRPIPSIRWTFSGSGGPLLSKHQLQGNVLRIIRADKMDNGVFTCTAENVAGVASAQAVVNVESQRLVEPVVEIYPRGPFREIIPGQSLTVECRTSAGFPRPTVTWSRQGGGDFGPYTEVVGSSLRFRRISSEDAGNYVCTGSNIAGTQLATVQIGGIVIRELEDKEIRAPLGARVRLECTAIGLGRVDVQWQSPRGERLSSTTSQTSSPSGQYIGQAEYIIDPFTANDVGAYTCLAKSSYDQATAVLTVLQDQGSVGPPVLQPLQDINTPLYSTVTLTCTGSGNPPPVLSWERVGRPLPAKARIQPGLMVIDNVQAEDAGEYMCIGINQGGRAEARFRINILGPITISPESQTVRVGGRVQLRCNADNGEVTWTRGDRQTLPTNAETRPGGYLYIFNAQPSDSGIYECSVGPRKTIATVSVESPPGNVRISGGERPLTEGASVVLTCQASGRNLKYQWSRARGALPANNRGQGTNTLTLFDLKQEDTGRYLCVVSNNLGPSRGYKDIRILSASTGPPRDVAVTGDSGRNAVPVGSTVTLRCAHTAGSSARVEWRKDGGVIPGGRSSIRGGTLVISGVRAEDAGRYICEVTNDVGKASAYFQLRVEAVALPSIVGWDSSVYQADVGARVRLICDARGTPTPTVRWDRIPGGLPRSAIVRGNVLYLQSAQVTDAGAYVCVASNSAGSVRKQRQLFVVGASTTPSTTGPASDTIYTAYNGKSATLRCSSPDTELRSVRWSRTVGRLPAGSAQSAGTLTIPSVMKEDQGTYICTAQDSQGRTLTKEVFLVVGDIIPEFKQDRPSYLRLRQMQTVNNFDIVISFYPTDEDGLIFYNGLLDFLDGDFVSFGLIRGVPELRFELGSGPAIISGAPIRMNKWHTVRLRREWTQGFMTVDGIEYSGKSVGSYTGLDLAQEDLFLGGMQDFSKLPRNSGDYKKGFSGAISQLKLEGELIDLWSDNKFTENVGEYPVCDTAGCQNSSPCLSKYVPLGFVCVCHKGFTGDRCEKAGEQCYPGACGAGRCYNVDDGIRCVCPIGLTGPRCGESLKVNDPALQADSFLAYNTLPDSLLNTKIQMMFKARAITDSVLLYNGQLKSGRGDFIALVIKNGYLEFIYDSGSGAANIRSREPLKVNEWTSIVAERNLQNGYLMVNNGEPVRANHEWRPQVIGRSPGSTRGLNLELPLYIGGVDRDSKIASVVGIKGSSVGFIGCITEVKVNGVRTDLLKQAIASGGIQDCGDDQVCSRRPCRNGATCEALNHDDYICLCAEGYTGRNCETEVNICLTANPCQNGATCHYTGKAHTCLCPIGFVGSRCETDIRDDLDILPGSPAGFQGDGYLEFDRKLLPHVGPDVISFTFTTNETNGLILWHGQKLGGRGMDFLAIGVVNGYLELGYELGSGPAAIQSLNLVNDSKPHRVSIERTAKKAILRVDSDALGGSSGGSLTSLDVNGNVFVGGVPNIKVETQGKYSQGFSGCLSDLSINEEKPVKLFSEALKGVNVGLCR